MERHFNIVVWGKVQGVTFRKFVREQAQKLGITGSVQNLPNGTVFIEAEAEEEKLNELIIACQKGSPASEVTAVKYSVAQMQQLEGFEIKE
ncbi:MAG: acylphosphatase [Bacteroidota bacterium]